MDAASSASALSSKTVRGCFELGTIELISTSLFSAIATPVGVVMVFGTNKSNPRPNPPLRALMRSLRFHYCFLLNLILVLLSLAQFPYKQLLQERMHPMS